eukprot:TRINITY_DN267_c2_g1_i1.p1 TRINITY_DN267_c2_g1~~TRINITY_DN267_c2_g1_i1.p1  ORF type:complete len:163 (-),score=16.54 TRINITY_DN267_c2_g1_i1:1168-1656(-)
MSWIFSSVKDWMNNLLYKIGLYSKNATIVLLGLDNAGKTTLLYKLKSGAVSSFVPTQRANVEEVLLGSVKFKAWDLGGAYSQLSSLLRTHNLPCGVIANISGSIPVSESPSIPPFVRVHPPLSHLSLSPLCNIMWRVCHQGMNKYVTCGDSTFRKQMLSCLS